MKTPHVINNACKVQGYAPLDYQFNGRSFEAVDNAP